jgi:hypothetical protein
VFAVLQLSPRWGEFFRSQPETGMGYWICSVVLKDGRMLRHVVVDGGTITSVDGSSDITFGEMDIAKFIVTHEKSASGVPK